MEKIKILRIINRFNIGGPTYNATFLTRFLSDDFETKLIGGLPDEGENDSLYILDEYGVEPELIEELVRNPDVKSDRDAYKKIKEIIQEYKPDIVHTHASKAGALGRRAAFSCKVPIVVHTFHGHVFHSYFGKAKTSVFKYIERKLAKKSTAIVAISELQKQELVTEHKICSMDKINVVPLGFDLLPYHEKRISHRDSTRLNLKLTNEIAIAIIGRFAPIKNHEFFLHVIEEVADKVTIPIKVFIVGDGLERDLIEARVSEINKKHNKLILLTSWISDIATFNAGMDIICLTSKNEGTPVSLIEAQAANIPVITTDVGGVRDIVLDSDTGFIVPVNDKKLYVKKLLELIENEKIREKMSQNGWTFVKEKFHYESLVQNMEQLYHSLLEKNKNEKI